MLALPEMWFTSYFTELDFDVVPWKRIPLFMKKCSSSSEVLFPLQIQLWYYRLHLLAIDFLVSISSIHHQSQKEYI